LKNPLASIRTWAFAISDCTTAPRNGLVSGCYPLDPFRRERDEAARLDEIKRALRG
jgi:hypothetical protein